MSIFKKLLIPLMILLAAAGGWYFLYWQNTPAFAAEEIPVLFLHSLLDLSRTSSIA